MIKVVVFDADNTLYKVNKEHAYDEKFSYLERETGIRKDKVRARWEKIKNDILKHDEKNPEKRKREYSTRLALIQLGVDSKKAERLSKNSIRLFRNIVLKDMDFDRNIRKIMQYLKRRYSMVITSEEFRNSLKEKLNKAFIDWKRYFVFMITPETTGEMKPSEKYYEIILKRMKVRPDEVIVVGDSWRRDLSLAKGIGMKTILLNEKIEGSPTHCISNIEEIAKIL